MGIALGCRGFRGTDSGMGERRGATRQLGLMTSVVIGPPRFDVANSDHKN
jgi:hypothetical protein